jgi:hypothetical protein
MATWPGRQLAPWFRDPEITAEDPAVAEHLGNPGGSVAYFGMTTVG